MLFPTVSRPRIAPTLGALLLATALGVLEVGNPTVAAGQSIGPEQALLGRSNGAAPATAVAVSALAVSALAVSAVAPAALPCVGDAAPVRAPNSDLPDGARALLGRPGPSSPTVVFGATIGETAPPLDASPGAWALLGERTPIRSTRATVLVSGPRGTKAGCA